MKKINLKIVGTITCSLFAISSFSQNWRVGGNTFAQLAGNPPILGTTTGNNNPLNIITSGVPRAIFTTGNTFGTNEDGLRFIGGNCNNYLDMWADKTGCETTVRFHTNGRVEGANSQLRVVGHNNGLNLNASANRIIFSRGLGFVETGRVGLNNFWKIGYNTFSGIDADRRLEVVDNTVQFRLTYGAGIFTDFETNNFANLRVNPAGGKVGISLLAGIDPTHTIDVNGNARIRNVIPTTTPNSLLVGYNITGANDIEVQRLGFNGNPNQALLGDGTWGTLPSNVTANNGVSVNVPTGEIQLGVPCTDDVGNPNTIAILANAFTIDRVVANRINNFWIASYDYETGGVGIGGQPSTSTFCNTGNTLEVSANMKNSQYGNNNASGLRLSKLIATSPPIANGVNGVDNTKVLTVDGDGDVVLVKAGGVGNYCSDPQNPLTSNYEIPLAGHDFYFSDNSGDGSVLIGDVSCGTNPIARLFVRNTGLGTATIGILSECGGFPNQTAGYFNASKYGVHALLTSSSAGMTAAFYGEAPSFSGLSANSWSAYLNGDISNVGGTYNPSDSLLKTNINPIENALNIIKAIETVTFNFNTLSFPSMNLPSGLEYGVIAENITTVLPDLVKNITHPEVLDSLGNIVYQEVEYQGVNYTELIPIVLAGVKELDAQVNAIRDSIIIRDSTIRRNDSLLQDVNDRTLSDGTLKNNVTPLTNSLALIKQLNGINFKWDTLSFPWKNFETDNQIGYIAQDVNNVVPEVIFQDDSGYFHVDYQRLLPLVTEGMKQLDEKNHVQDSIIQTLDSINNNLEDRLLALENCINEANLCGGNERTSNNQENEGKVIQLENLNAIILDQNLPNPFKESTIINYLIPDDVLKATLMFYDMNGRIIKQVDITERGEGKLIVYGENLQNGIYTYSLIADGKLIATKKMVKQ